MESHANASPGLITERQNSDVAGSGLVLPSLITSLYPRLRWIIDLAKLVNPRAVLLLVIGLTCQYIVTGLRSTSLYWHIKLTRSSQKNGQLTIVVNWFLLELLTYFTDWCEKLRFNWGTISASLTIRFWYRYNDVSIYYFNTMLILETVNIECIKKNGFFKYICVIQIFSF